MKTSLDLPDFLFRKAMATAAERGQSLRDFVAEALQEKLEQPKSRSMPGDPKWMRSFGRLKRLHKETARVAVGRGRGVRGHRARGSALILDTTALFAFR